MQSRTQTPIPVNNGGNQNSAARTNELVLPSKSVDALSGLSIDGLLAALRLVFDRFREQSDRIALSPEDSPTNRPLRNAGPIPDAFTGGVDWGEYNAIRQLAESEKYAAFGKQWSSITRSRLAAYEVSGGKSERIVNDLWGPGYLGSMANTLRADPSQVNVLPQEFRFLVNAPTNFMQRIDWLKRASALRGDPGPE